ncbi:MAG: ferrous iron transport protein B [Chthoniobacterales bacterium]
MTSLTTLKPGQSAVITRLPADEQLATRLREMGVLRGTEITFVRSAPLGDPMEFRLRGFELSIRRSDAAQVQVDETPILSGEATLRPMQPIPPAHVLSSMASKTILSIAHDHAAWPEDDSNPQVHPRSYAVVGNPNCGKTTLFNALTGLRQKVGNYPGVTVEKKSGQFIGQHGEKVELLDLPGSYSLGAHAPDERITRDVLMDLRQDTPRPGRILCVVDASHLERNLYFITQVLELRLPTIIALNMIDDAQAQGTPVNAERLAAELGVPVIPVQATKKETHLPLRLALSRASIPCSSWTPDFPTVWTRATDKVASHWPVSLPGHARDEASRLGDPQVRMKALILLSAPEAETAAVAAELGAGPAFSTTLGQRTILDRELPEWREIVVAERYERIGKLCHAAQGGMIAMSDKLTQRLDDLLTHKAWGWLVFLGMMVLMFVSIFTIASYPMGWIEKAFGAVTEVIRGAMPSGDLRDLLTDGVLPGVGGVVVFLPQILILFFFIGLLEDTGYMARAAFLMDRVMSKVGLHGKSFIPLLSSYACAIPGIMSTRTIENPKDRLVTILVAPLMSCSARLPVYALMIAALLPSESVLIKGVIMMGLYLLGTVAALLFAWLFKKTILRGETPIFLMELPPYRLPSLRQIASQMFQRAGLFLKRAGTVILSISIILWFLATFPKMNSPVGMPEPTKTEQLQHSYAGRIGHALEPAIAPLGMDWKIGIGLVAAQAAREVFVGTMSIVYNVEGGEDQKDGTLVKTLREQKRPDGTRVFTPLTCLSILVFFVLSMQCVSTLAVVRRETNSLRWPLFQFCYMTGTAYLASLLVYQGGKLLGFD